MPCEKGIDGFVENILFLIGWECGYGKLVAEFLDGFLEIRYFCNRSMYVENRKSVREAQEWCQQTNLSSFAVYEGPRVVT